ncbi:hypothetical protein DLAC_00121 [Tieghemostelium lacteum]|uniref:Uncharacterized protein n=1 Tax=Tieghemostelium lacteum TaxID=361077 RepID=A0A152A8W7_TIELA|nr:hypothetical protein DLAC_00121 [Tieghemostelium lacteum]|eukprot:KYR02666.1 hypothetical protein DLAC_00121 [Tieghemostelium lacteum]
MSHLIDSYKLISSKVKKKKFSVRKPNYGEAIEQLTQVMNSFKREGNGLYAAFCCLAIGRCEQAIKLSSSAEASCYIDSGYLIWENEIQSFEDDLISFEENIPEAINCYLLAIKVYQNYKRFSIMATLYYEMASILKKLSKYEQGAEYFQKAAELQRTESPISSIYSLKEACYCKIMESDYKGACDYLDLIITIINETTPLETKINLNNSTGSTNNNNSLSQINNNGIGDAQLSNISLSLFPYLLIETRVSLVLLLILQDSFLKSQAQLSKLVNDINDQEGQSTDHTEETVSLLNNLLISCERKEINDLQAIQRELWSSLNDIQNDILQRIWVANKILI